MRQHPARLAIAQAFLLLSALYLPACGSEDGAAAKTDDTSPTDAGAGLDTATTSDGTGAADGASVDAGSDTGAQGNKTNTLLADGAYFIGIKLSLAGAQLRIKAVVTAEGEAGKGGKLTKIELFGLGAASDWVSPTANGSVADVAVAADGTFKANFGFITIPGQSSPTGTPVGTNLTIEGTIDSKSNTFCGNLSGDIPAFQASLSGSTFKAVPFGTEADPYLVSCAAQVKIYEHIKACPTLKAGLNSFESAGFKRNFVLNLPAEATATTGGKLPVVFLYHGNTGNAAGILQYSGWPLIQKAEKKQPFILIAPNTAANVNGKKPVLDWRYGEKVFDLDNRELVFFDDMLKCVSKQYNVDADRVYVTGMSAGSMMTVFLTAHRGDKLAAAAPFSGGYLHPWPKKTAHVPTLVSWGGAADFAYSQNFDLLAKKLMQMLTTANTFYAKCNHGTGHKMPFSLVPHSWTFLKAHKRGVTPSPFASGLPKEFPSYCSLPSK